MIENFEQLSFIDPYKCHYSKSNALLENISDYSNYLIIDLFDTFASICYCDFYNKRNEDKFNVVNLNIGVTTPEKFDMIKFDLEKLISFMTNGEIWKISFYKKQKSPLIATTKTQMSIKKNINSIALLSGGLDALAGAFQELNNNTLFITFETNKTESNKAKQSFEMLSKLNENCYHVRIPKLQFEKKKQTTQRTRTLLFIGSALIYADFYEIDTIKIYENGIMSLNPTFAYRRRVTHTTHPKTLYIINDIFKKLGVNIKVINPFNFMTKAEVINLIPKECSNIISNTKTCSKMPGSKPFQNRKNSGICQCGMCTACVLRQISILNSNKMNFDDNYILPSNIASLSEIEKYENDYGVDNEKVRKISHYKYVEKQSLLQYYNEFKNKILSGDIYRYLELSPILFENSDYKEKYNIMLSRFVKEIEKYLNSQI